MDEQSVSQPPLDGYHDYDSNGVGSRIMENPPSESLDCNHTM